MSQNEEKLFMLMAHAEDLQRIADESLQAVNGAVRHLENDSVEAITGAIRVGIDQTLVDTQKGLQEATEGLVGASSEAKTTCALLKNTVLFQCVFLVALSILLAGALFTAVRFMVSSKLDELSEIRATIRAEEATLTEIQAKTWKLELVNYDNGTRGIILPKKGIKIDRIALTKDGREVIIIK